MNKIEIYKSYALDKDLTTYHYKVLFLLMVKPMTQAEISEVLCAAKQNVNRVCKDLISIGYVTIDHTVGRNKYLKINTNPNIQLIGQQTLFN